MHRRSTSRLLQQCLQGLGRQQAAEVQQSAAQANTSQQLQHWAIDTSLSDAGLPKIQRRWWSTDAPTSKKAQKKSKQPMQQDENAPSTSSSISTVGLMPYRRPRFQQFYDNIAARELVLKKNITSYHELPRIQRLDLSFTAPDNFKQIYADKWQMLFYALGLEYLTGRVATFDTVQQKHLSGTETSAVRVSIGGPEAYEFLEKLALLLLPHQVAFSGIPLEQLDGAFSLSFSVKNLLSLPDFEELFDLFEGLDGMQVRIVMDNVSTPQDCALLLSAFSIPTKIKAKKGAAAAAAAAAAAEQAAEGSAAPAAQAAAEASV